MSETLAQEIETAERKAWDALGRYKFQMFGYWAGIWVHLNRIEGSKRPNPWKGLVQFSRAAQEKTKTFTHDIELATEDDDLVITECDHSWVEGPPDRGDEGPIRCEYCGADGDA